jgi:hypothetical protein
VTRTAVAVSAALVALAFALSTFERWVARKRPQELAWSGAFAMFCVAAGALALGADAGWSGPTFRVFYLFGAIVDVPFLALGTVYLLFGSRWGSLGVWVVALVSAFAAGVMVMAPFTHPLPLHRLAQGSQVLGPLPRVLAGACSGVGAVVVVGGALWSAVRHHGILSNLLIALGTLVLGASGLFNSVFDAMTAFAVTLLVGISVLFAGFLLVTARA